MIDFEINFDPDDLIPKPTEIQNALNRQLTKAEREIVQRTQAGLDVNGSPHSQGYSPKYAEFREKKGRQTGAVDHTFTGEMLNAVTHETEIQNGEVAGRIYFGTASASEKAAFNNERREFFGLSETQKTELEEAIKEALPK